MKLGCPLGIEENGYDDDEGLEKGFSPPVTSRTWHYQREREMAAEPKVLRQE